MRVQTAKILANIDCSVIIYSPDIVVALKYMPRTTGINISRVLTRASRVLLSARTTAMGPHGANCHVLSSVALLRPLGGYTTSYRFVQFEVRLEKETGIGPCTGAWLV